MGRLSQATGREGSFEGYALPRAGDTVRRTRWDSFAIQGRGRAQPETTRGRGAPCRARGRGSTNSRRMHVPSVRDRPTSPAPCTTSAWSTHARSARARARTQRRRRRKQRRSLSRRPGATYASARTALGPPRAIASSSRMLAALATAEGRPHACPSCSWSKASGWTWTRSRRRRAERPVRRTRRAPSSPTTT